jgi:hypothetical protein
MQRLLAGVCAQQAQLAAPADTLCALHDAPTLAIYQGLIKATVSATAPGTWCVLYALATASSTQSSKV